MPLRFSPVVCLFATIREDNLLATTFSATALPAGRYRVWVRAISNATSAPWSPLPDFTVN